MKLHEILEEAQVVSGDMWFRPVSWKYCGSAFTITAGRVYVVPSATGGDIGITASVACLVGDWVLVDPEEVCTELYKLQDT